MLKKYWYWVVLAVIVVVLCIFAGWQLAGYIGTGGIIAKLIGSNIIGSKKISRDQAATGNDIKQAKQNLSDAQGTASELNTIIADSGRKNNEIGNGISEFEKLNNEIRDGLSK